MEKKYLNHSVFKQLSEYASFYDDLSFSVMSFATMGTKSFLNIDTYVYTSIQGTLESIKEILLNGRINDAYTLLRKYYDACTINIYTNLYLDDNLSIENFIVEKIDNWVKGKEQLPDIRNMNSFIQKSKVLEELYKIINFDKRYSKLRNRCNDNAHYNYYYNMVQNDNSIYLEDRIRILDQFSKDLDNIFIYHLSFLFYIKEHYMMASDYLDCLEDGVTPEPESQYLVAPFIQEIFENVIKKKRMDIAREILEKTSMKLE